MTYFDVYPDCRGCPVKRYCGTMISCTKLCRSYGSSDNNSDSDSIK